MPQFRQEVEIEFFRTFVRHGRLFRVTIGSMKADPQLSAQLIHNRLNGNTRSVPVSGRSAHLKGRSSSATGCASLGFSYRRWYKLLKGSPRRSCYLAWIKLPESSLSLNNGYTIERFRVRLLKTDS